MSDAFGDTLLQASPAGTFWNTSKDPSLLGAKGTREASPVQMRKEQRKEEDNRARGHLYLLTTPTPKKGENPRLGQSLVKLENISLSWALLYPNGQGQEHGSLH